MPLNDTVFYKTPAGNEPVLDWLRGLPKDHRKAIGGDIRKVEVLWPVGRPLVGSFGKGMWEVITIVEKVEYRALFGIVGNTMYVVHALVKKTNATPKADKDLAYGRLAEVNANEKKAQQAKKTMQKKTK
jgi:phage-related protein